MVPDPTPHRLVTLDGVRIAVRDDVERNDVLACLRAKGVERLGWSEIGDAVVVNPIAVRAGATV